MKYKLKSHPHFLRLGVKGVYLLEGVSKISIVNENDGYEKTIWKCDNVGFWLNDDGELLIKIEHI